ncbi:MAG: ATP-binding protein [Acidimicrobiia bacterium]|nr:ATP-binding protein [Acidimicrobiia bacterium]
MSNADEDVLAGLSSTVIQHEAERQAQADAEGGLRIRDLDELPGVGGEPMPLRKGIAAGGVGVIGVLGLLDAFDAVHITIPALLGPEIQETFDLSDTGLAVMGVGGLITTTLFAVPMGRLADRVDRMKLVGIATIYWSVLMAVRGFQSVPFMYFLIGVLIGIGTANTQPVQGAVLADAYPIEARGRIYALKNILGRSGERLSPLLIGVLMLLVDDNWRWAYWVFSIPTFLLGVAALRVKDPPRGQYEQQSVLGEVMVEEDPPPMALSAVWHRLMAIQTIKLAWFAFSAVVFAIIGQGFLRNLYLEDRFDLSPFERALVGVVPGVLALAAAPLLATRYDHLYQQDPAKGLRFVGALFIPLALFIPVQYAMPSAVAFALVGIIPGVLEVVIFGMVAPLFTSVVPYRLRAQSIALSMVVIFLGGGVLGPILAGLLSDATDERTAIILISVPAKLIGGFLLMWGSRSIHHDLSLVVDELEKDKADLDRRLANPGAIPALQIRDIDHSYGSVQVLFDVGFAVAPGESLALLGTNGAGKSTILKVISGLEVPSRGLIRHHGHDITLTSPQVRVARGIHQLPGGHGVFGPLTVRENLNMATWVHRRDRDQSQARIDGVLPVFPQLTERLDEPAHDLSGGQQQMLALAMVLLHEPDILLIDELSLGLAPAVVSELLDIITELRSQGQTMIIVEQSLNIALALADRAVFLEKGRVRFDGPTVELADSDIARAVFLGDDR